MHLLSFWSPRLSLPGGGFDRFKAGLAALPPGAEGHVWFRMPIQLGDLVMALPSLFAVKDAWEAWAAARGVRLKFTVTGKRSASLFQEADPEVFAACHVDEDFGPSRSPFKLKAHWGQERPLAVINYTKSDRLKVAAWLSGVPVRAGIAHGSALWTYHYSHRFFGENAAGHTIFRYLPLTRWLAGPEARQRMPRLDAARFGGHSVLAILREAGWDGGPYVVLGAYPHHRYPGRRWFPVDAPWVKLAGLARAAGVTPVLVGGPEHREALEAIAAQGGALCLAGRTSLPQLLALLSQAMGTIAVDTGIAHLAAATGKPTVVVFGIGTEFLDIPAGERVVALRGNPAGAPAYPLTPETMASAKVPWAEATSTISAERAWGVLNYLASEAPLG